MQGFMSVLFNTVIPCGLIIVFVMLFTKKRRAKYDEQFQNSLVNQQEIIALLKEIRDALKK